MDGYRRAEDESCGDHELVCHWINCRQDKARCAGEEGTRGERTMGHVQSGDTRHVHMLKTCHHRCGSSTQCLMTLQTKKRR
jgi:hypothetical protein